MRGEGSIERSFAGRIRQNERILHSSARTGPCKRGRGKELTDTQTERSTFLANE